MTSRSKRALIAVETLKILSKGTYVSASHRKVIIDAALKKAIDGTKLYSPEDFWGVFARRDEILNCINTTARQTTLFQVRNRTTLAAAREFVRDANDRVLCLNFASAKNPGGGFLGGSQAQEESLARASGLYECIHRIRPYYESNRACETCMYTDHMIYSPAVPVFRDDDDELIDEPYCASMPTAPAPNRGAIENNEPHRIGEVRGIMHERIDRVLAIALVEGYQKLVLGAWGCGVFKNDPHEVASLFAELLLRGPYRDAFSVVEFAVLDHTETKMVIAPFQAAFCRHWAG